MLHQLPRPVFTAATCVCIDRMYVVKHDIQYCHLETESWTILQRPLPFEIGIHQAVCIGTKIYLLGQYINKFTEFDTETKTCVELGRFKEASGAMCQIQSQVYVVGGDECDKVEVYNMDTRQFDEVATLKAGLRCLNLVAMPIFPKFR